VVFRDYVLGLLCIWSFVDFVVLVFQDLMFLGFCIEILVFGIFWCLEFCRHRIFDVWCLCGFCDLWLGDLVVLKFGDFVDL